MPTQKFGSAPISKLLFEQAFPASIGILVMSIYGIVDTIFVGKFIGTDAIAALTVVLPIVILVGTTGMAIGIGGSSLISLSLGKKNLESAKQVFGNMLLIILFYALFILLIFTLFDREIIMLFGGEKEVLTLALVYFKYIIPSFPFFIWMSMSNTLIRAEGHPKIAMFTMIVPALVNLVLDPIFILWLDMGMEGAAWATAIGYMTAGLFNLIYFFSSKSIFHFTSILYKFDANIIKKILGLGSVSFLRQGIISLLAIVLNNSLLKFGGTDAISAYGIVQRVMIFTNFPANGIIQGFLPIAAYNYGAKKWTRLKMVLILAIKSGAIISIISFLIIMIFSTQLVQLFTNDESLIRLTKKALQICYLASPLIIIHLISSAYFQAIGKALPAFFLAILKQGIILIPLLFILPNFWGIDSIWISFPIADLISGIVCLAIFHKELKK